MKNEYIITKTITSVDVDYKLEVKLSSLFLFFQEVSALQAEVLHIGNAATIDKGLHWVITRFEVEVIRMPIDNEVINVSTYPGESNGLFFYRHYRITDKKGNLLVKAASVWVVIDANTHQVKRDPFNGMKLPIEHYKDELAIPGKVVTSDMEYIYSRVVKYSDIDLNTHLNNTRYIEFISDSFPLSFYNEYKIKNILINYNAEFVVDDEIKIYRSSSNPYIVSGRKDDKDHFLAKLEFCKR